jgi:RNA polymerase sigma-70 factor (ECF subfamily)
MPVEPIGSPDFGLLQRVAARDAAAIRELYDRYNGLLFGVIMRILRNRSDAEEVLQEVFIRVWTRAEMYDARVGAPAPWLVRLARNRAIDRLRARRVHDTVDEHVDGTADRPALPSAQATPEGLALDAEKRESVRGALGDLPEEQRTLIEAAFFEGYTHSELASRFGLPLGTVKTRIRIGMMAMRARLEHSA